MKKYFLYVALLFCCASQAMDTVIQKLKEEHSTKKHEDLGSLVNKRMDSILTECNAIKANEDVITESDSEEDGSKQVAYEYTMKPSVEILKLTLLNRDQK